MVTKWLIAIAYYTIQHRSGIHASFQFQDLKGHHVDFFINRRKTEEEGIFLHAGSLDIITVSPI